MAVSSQYNVMNAAQIKQYVEQTFGYDLNHTCDEIRPTYHHVKTCQETVPEAIIAFLESVSCPALLRTTDICNRTQCSPAAARNKILYT